MKLGRNYKIYYNTHKQKHVQVNVAISGSTQQAKQNQPKTTQTARKLNENI